MGMGISQDAVMTSTLGRAPLGNRSHRRDYALLCLTSRVLFREQEAHLPSLYMLPWPDLSQQPEHLHIALLIA